jgi:hypothetical protein
VIPIRIASLLFLAALQAGCSRSSDSPDAASTLRHPEKHARATKKISEEQALALLMSELRAQKVPDLDCLAFQNESSMPAGSKSELWEFSARERHNERCGGDPAVFPVRDRYKVSSAGKVWKYDVVNDQYSLF